MRFDPGSQPAGLRVANFRDVDASADAGPYIRFLDRAAADLREMIGCGIDLLRLTPGAAVLDVGCGHGASAPALAERVGASGSVKGVDASMKLVAEAQRRFGSSGRPIDIRVGNAEALDFPNASFDASRADRVLMFISDPRAAVHELARVTKSGGRVVVSEADLGASLVDAADRETTREILAGVMDEIANPWIGRQLRAHFLHAGLVDVEVYLFPVLSTSLGEWRCRMGIDEALAYAIRSGRVRRESGEAWLAQLHERDARGAFLATSLFFMVSGTRR